MTDKNKIIVKIPLVKYLREITRDWTTPYVTKTFGGKVWVSDDAPGECYEEFKDSNPNYVEFNDSNIYFRLPKEVHQFIDLEPGSSKLLKQVLLEIKQKEKAA